MSAAPVIDKKALISIRDLTPGDISFIYASWLKGVRFGDEFYELIDSTIFFQQYHRVIELVLSRSTTKVKIACLVEDPSVILGYSVYENSTLHWAFVKKRWRNIGIAKDLVPSDVSTVTHITKVGKSLLKKYPAVKFNPFKL